MKSLISIASIVAATLGGVPTMKVTAAPAFPRCCTDIPLITVTRKGPSGSAEYYHARSTARSQKRQRRDMRRRHPHGW
jgi:hypothetical protein